jgi:8-oxo-dGTP pyrophosphatase MutT (NUDIX family)
MAHIHEKIDFTATVLIVCDGKVLLRKHDKYEMWFGVGGHIELDEDANAAALREVKEEVGLVVTLVPPPHWEERMPPLGTGRELIPPMFMNIHKITDIHQHHDLIFIAKSETQEVIPETSTDEWKWCTKEDLENFDGLETQTRHAEFALELVGK